MLGRLQLAAESRQDIWPEEARRPFYLYVDEFQNYATSSFEELLAESRGLGLSLVMANQHLAQLDPGLQHAILSNARIRVAFRVNYEDATILAREFFRFAGDRVKDKELEWVKLGRGVAIPVGYKYYYYSASDEGRQNREALHYLPDRLLWVHLQGEPSPYRLRSVDMPRAQLAASRDRVARLKELINQVQRVPALDAPAPVAAPSPGRTYEWAGRDQGSEVGRS